MLEPGSAGWRSRQHARKNLAQSGVAERVELRSKRVEHLDDEKIFTLAWLRGPFIAAEIITLALERIHRALTPGGWFIIGALCAADRCARRSAHEFADRVRRRSSVDHQRGRGAPRGGRLRADRSVFALA